MAKQEPPRGKKLRYSFIAAGIVILALIVVWVGRPKKSSDKTLRKITIAQYGDVFLYAPLYIAKDAGMFEKNGLDVSIISTGGDEKTWAAVTSGNASFGVADPTFVAISDARGQPGKIVASIVNGVPFWGVTYKKAIGVVSSPRGLDGLTVATFPSPSTAFTLQRKMFLDAGLQPRIREGAFGTLLPMLKAGQADIALELEPNVSQALADGAHVAYSLSDVYGDFAITGLTTTPALINKDPKLARSVVCSIQMGIDYARRDRRAALQLLIRRFPDIRPEIAESALNRILDSGVFPRKTAMDSRAWDKAIRVRVEVGDLMAPKDVGAYVDNEFADDAERDCRLGPNAK